MADPYREGGPLGLDDLYAHERAAFGALVRLVVTADRRVEPTENAALATLAAELGEDDFWTLLEEAERADEGNAHQLAEAVARREARELIYGCVSEVAFASAFSEEASSVLAELRSLWSIEEHAVLDDPAG